MTKKIRYKICISGGSKGKNAEKAFPLARKVAQEIAERGNILITGATTGVPFEAAKANKEAGGSNIGFSPAGSEIEHKNKFRLPCDPEIFDHIIYAESGYTGRNLLMVRSSDATIIIDGRIGTLNEFTSAFEEDKVIGILEGSGGIADHIKYILDIAKRGYGKVVFSSDPVDLVNKVIEKIKETKKK